MTRTPAPRLLTAPGSRLDIVVSDIDSTLADTRHRRDRCPATNPQNTWDDYAATCGNDAPIAGTLTLLRMLYAAGYGIHLVSNRPVSAYDATAAWLTRQSVRYNALRLRREDEPFDGDIKVAYLREIRSFGYHPVLFLEDWPANAAAIEAEGVPVLCVNPRYGDETR